MKKKLRQKANLIEVTLKANKNLSTETAEALAGMFCLAYEQFTQSQEEKKNAVIE